MKKKILVVFTLGLISCLAFGQIALAEDVVITAAPSYVGFSSSPGTWTMNGIDHDGKIDVDTIYYANPDGTDGDTTAPSATVLDAECLFTWVNTSSVNITVSVHCGNFTGGDAAMTNSNDGTNGATTFGGYSWVSGQTYATDKAIMKDIGDCQVYNTTSPGEDKMWGCEIETRTDPWTGPTASTTTMVISAVENVGGP